MNSAPRSTGTARSVDRRGFIAACGLLVLLVATAARMFGADATRVFGEYRFWFALWKYCISFGIQWQFEITRVFVLCSIRLFSWRMPVIDKRINCMSYSFTLDLLLENDEWYPWYFSIRAVSFNVIRWKYVKRDVSQKGRDNSLGFENFGLRLNKSVYTFRITIEHWNWNESQTPLLTYSFWEGRMYR